MAPVSESATSPVKTFDETEVIQSSNTWEFLLFEQIRTIRMLQTGIFSVPREARFKILDLIVAMNHLESMMYDRINPTRDGLHKNWKDYQMRKPDMFKNLHEDRSMGHIRELINSNEFDQLKILALLEKWFTALDKYMVMLKKVAPTSFEMEVPDIGDIDLPQPMSQSGDM